jgi:curved DNA-binding protein CbpA
MLKKYFLILGLKDSNKLTIEDTDKKFKSLAKDLHPDINPDENSLVKMKELIEAREKIKEYLAKKNPQKAYKSYEEVYIRLKKSLFKLIEQHFKVLDGYRLCDKLWPVLEKYDKAMKDKPKMGAKGGFSRLFEMCGFVKKVFDEKNRKYIYKKLECSTSSAMKLVNLLKNQRFIEYERKGAGRSSTLRITINRENMARFLIEKGHEIGLNVKLLEHKPV